MMFDTAPQVVHPKPLRAFNVVDRRPPAVTRVVRGRAASRRVPVVPMAPPRAFSVALDEELLDIFHHEADVQAPYYSPAPPGRAASCADDSGEPQGPPCAEAAAGSSDERISSPGPERTMARREVAMPRVESSVSPAPIEFFTAPALIDRSQNPLARNRNFERDAVGRQREQVVATSPAMAIRGGAAAHGGQDDDVDVASVHMGLLQLSPPTSRLSFPVF
eukprot:m51a1_g9453 hypothetical protein (220) ;mRNA; r:502855-503777